MTPTMPADCKQVEEAVERLCWWLRNFPGYAWIADYKGDIEALLTDHAALLAQIQAERSRAEGWKRSAEAAEARVRELEPLHTAFSNFRDAALQPRAAHQQPAPVKAGGEG